MVLDIDVPNRIKNIPIVLGRPFLATARVVKNYDDGSLHFSINGEKFHIDVNTKQKRKNEDNS